jgi:hypothetical protein
MHSSKVFALSTGLALAATMMVSASAAVPTNSGNRTLSGVDQLATMTNFQPHELVASGGSKRCQLYYGCIPTPAPAPAGGGKKSSQGSGHKFAVEVARDKRDNDKNDNRGKDVKDMDGKGHKFAVEVARDKRDNDKNDNRGKDVKDMDGKGHKFAVEVARDKRDNDKNDNRGHDGAGHKFVEWAV